MIYKVISTGSKGNAVVYKNVMVDCGVSFTKLKDVYKELSLVLLTHVHSDHFNKATIRKLAKERPTLRFACPIYLLLQLKELGVKNIDLVEAGKGYKYENMTISPIKLYHDVDNIGYRIFFKDYKILHATDTVTLDGITAKGYDLYAIEFNHCELQIEKDIQEKIERGEFAYEIGARESHLSFQKAEKFIEENRKETSEVLKLHVSSRYEK